MNVDSYNAVNMILSKTGNTASIGLYYYGSIDFYVYTTSAVLANKAAPSTGVWHYLVGTYDGSNVTVYIDGVAGTPVAQTGNTNAVNTNLQFGSKDGANYPINGYGDEARISSIARSADWIKTEYNNQCSPSTFYAYGALGANGRQSSSGAAVPAVRVRGGVNFH